MIFYVFYSHPDHIPNNMEMCKWFLKAATERATTGQLVAAKDRFYNVMKT